MTRMQRIRSFLTGLIMGAAGIFLAVYQENSFWVIASLLALAMLLSGIRYLIYYFTMARHMVGGISILFIGIFILDFGFFTMTLVDEPRVYIGVYLIGLHAVSAVLNLFKSLQERKLRAPAWRMDFLQGAGNLLILFLCLRHLEAKELLSWIFCAGLLYSALLRIIAAFRRTEMVYIA